MAKYVSSCQTRARNKGTNKASAGLLLPLPVPSHPRSHISMDVVTELPVSEGNTVILRVVYCFSKMTHFIPLPKLPSAKEMAEIILAQVVKIHGLHMFLIEDHSLSHIFGRLWKVDFLGATVCLLDTILN